MLLNSDKARRGRRGEAPLRPPLCVQKGLRHAEREGLLPRSAWEREKADFAIKEIFQLLCALRVFVSSCSSWFFDVDLLTGLW